MPSFPIPRDEEARLSALSRCRVLDTPPERIFDDVAQLASQLCGAPIALVSLIDRSRQWFKARVGLDFAETSRGASLCAHAIVAKGPMVVRDARADARFAGHALVTGPTQIRFYAAVPLVVDDGHALGTVCVMDRVPRDLTPAQVRGLVALARRTSAELSLRSCVRSQEREPDDEESVLTTGYVVRSVPRNRSEEAHVAPPGSSAHGPRTSTSRKRAAELPVEPGSVVGSRYRIEKKLGAGGMGVVASALDLRRNTPVAIKFMHPSAAADPHAMRRFAREAQVLFSLESEHVARVLDFGRLESDAPYIVMERLEGLDLAAHIERQDTLSVTESVAILRQACDAVQVAHEQGILHRDLKPANLFLTYTPDRQLRLKVLDFGISKLLEPDERDLETALTSAASELGSPRYMAPEQMLSAAEADVRSDVWSLGIVLFEMLTGKVPFTGPTRLEVCCSVLISPLPSLLELRPDVPPALVSVVTRCLQKQAELRYQTVRELETALYLSRLQGAPGRCAAGPE
jgi:tRNA A-37 threonylcarbamoyl transferase component Bud32